VKIELRTEASMAVVLIANQGPPINAALIDRIFEYGVSDPNAPQTSEQRGQGLYVARTYMAKMGGTIVAVNTTDGVCFELRLPLRVSALA
jgi:sensor histidine kinase regulating citrate/malate metabolism